MVLRRPLRSTSVSRTILILWAISFCPDPRNMVGPEALPQGQRIPRLIMRRHPTNIVDESPGKNVTAFETEYKDPCPSPAPSAPVDGLLLKQGLSCSVLFRYDHFHLAPDFGSKWPPRNRRPSRDGRYNLPFLATGGSDPSSATVGGANCEGAGGRTEWAAARRLSRPDSHAASDGLRCADT
jgi:hypothetical protein